MIKEHEGSSHVHDLATEELFELEMKEVIKNINKLLITQIMMQESTG